MRGWIWCLVLGAIAGLIFGLLWGKMILIGLFVGAAIGIFIGSATEGFVSFMVLLGFSLLGTAAGLICYLVGLGVHAVHESIWAFVIFGIIAFSVLRIRLLTVRTA